MTVDFSQLYSHLGLRADCTLAEFRYACRQRIAQLHPDRGANPQHHDELSELLRMYTSAIRFHRRHGRLPGASARLDKHTTLRSDASRRTARYAPARAAPRHGYDDPAPPPAAMRMRPKWPVAFVTVLVAMMVFLALTWDWQVDTAVRAIAPSDPATFVASTAPFTDDPEPFQAPRRQLEPGMDPATVMAVQGKPLAVNGNRWDYGPSWIRFENNQLVDWHNSPLHPLKISGTSADAPGR